MKMKAVVSVSVVVFATLLGVVLAQEGAGLGLNLAEHRTLGAYLTDANGQALYRNLNDEMNVSNCDDSCAQLFPPMLVEAAGAGIVAGEGVAQELIGTTERPDGQIQVTYAGWPLYRFSRDIGPFTSGQGAAGTWFLVSPEGLALGAPEEPEPEGVMVDPMDLARVIGPGRDVYVLHCVVCHSLDGSGGVGQSLVGNERLLDTDHVLSQIMRGTRFMPRFDAVLNDEEIALVATYVRNSWGNRFGLVEEEEVSRKR